MAAKWRSECRCTWGILSSTQSVWTTEVRVSGFTGRLPSGKVDAIKQRLYILADGWDPSPFRHFAAKVTGKPGWDIIKIACGHDVMVDRPEELAAALAKLA